MREFYVEDQYRVVGTDGHSTHVSWRDTVDEAIAAAIRFPKSWVYRPDGSLVGIFNGRPDIR